MFFNGVFFIVGKINKFELAGIDLLEYLMTFLEKEEKFLNPTLAGYFQKAINAILNKRGFDVIF